MFVKINDKRRSERGQALVELAIILPLILIILFGIVEFGRVFSTQLTVIHASREGARFGSVGNSDEEIIERVERAATNLNIEELQVEITPNLAHRKRGADISVRVNYPVSLYTPFISQLIENPYPALGVTTMRVE